MSIYNKLYDWQKNIIDKYKDRNSLGLYLDMGLGKTPLSLALSEVNNCDKILIITINSKIDEDETVNGSFPYWIKMFDGDFKILKKGSKFDLECISKCCMIVNYEYLFERSKDKKVKVQIRKEILDFLNSCKNQCLSLIIDESQKMKSPSSMQTLSIQKIQKLGKSIANNVYSYLLSGTPFTQGYIDLFTQLKFLGYEITKTQFVDNFCIKGNLPGLLGWQQPIVGYKNLNLLYDIIHRYAITIKSNEVINLPDKIFKYIKCPITKEFKLFDNEKEDNVYYHNIDYPDDKYFCTKPGITWLRARQLSIGFQGNSEDYTWYNKERLNKLKEFLKENKDNYILFYNFTPELFSIFDICEELDYNIDVYCGEIKSMYFYEKYKNLSEEEKLVNKNNIILVNFASGAIGKNWQEYNKCIMFSIPLYKDYEQSLKRINRIGQKETCFYYIFYQSNWLDYSMKYSLDSKVQYNEDLFIKYQNEKYSSKFDIE